MSKREILGVKINDKFVNQILNTPEITDVIKRYAESEYKYSQTAHSDDETHAHLDVVFTFMFSELKPLVDEHIKMNPGEWYFIDYLQCFGHLLSKFHEEIWLIETLVDTLNNHHDEDWGEYDASEFDTTD